MSDRPHADTSPSDPVVEASTETEDLLEVTPEEAIAEAEVIHSDLLTQERDAFRDMAQRVQADFENFKKRVEKLERERVARAAEGLVAKLLPVLDTIDLALAHDPHGSLEQVKASLYEVLTKEGLERIPSVDQPFDPNEHEAVMHEPGEGEPMVTEEMRAGYRWNGRVIRPAMVKVAG